MGGKAYMYRCPLNGGVCYAAQYAHRVLWHNLCTAQTQAWAYPYHVWTDIPSQEGPYTQKLCCVITSSCVSLCAGVHYSYPTKKLNVTQKCLHRQVFESGLSLCISCMPCRTALVMYKWKYCLFLHVCIVLIQLEHVCQKSLNLWIVHFM